MNTEKSHELFSRAKLLLPGGVNSPVRAFKSVGGEPFFAARAEGAYIIDVDGNRYVDYIGSWGPMIAGHAHPKVLQAVSDVMKNGLSFGVPNALEVTMAETITRLAPSCEMVRMVNSGTEATLSAIRLARSAFTASGCCWRSMPASGAQSASSSAGRSGRAVGRNGGVGG